MFSVESFVYAWDNQLHYALALVNDLKDQQFVLRPGGNMNHPAWILGHVAAYHQVTLQLLAGEPVVVGVREVGKPEPQHVLWLHGSAPGPSVTGPSSRVRGRGESFRWAQTTVWPASGPAGK